MHLLKNIKKKKDLPRSPCPVIINHVWIRWHTLITIWDAASTLISALVSFWAFYDIYILNFVDKNYATKMESLLKTLKAIEDGTKEIIVLLEEVSLSPAHIDKCQRSFDECNVLGLLSSVKVFVSSYSGEESAGDQSAVNVSWTVNCWTVKSSLSGRRCVSRLPVIALELLHLISQRLNSKKIPVQLEYIEEIHFSGMRAHSTFQVGKTADLSFEDTDTFLSTSDWEPEVKQELTGEESVCLNSVSSTNP